MSDPYRAHRLIFKRFSATQFQNAYSRIKGASKLPLDPAVRQQLAHGLYKAQKNILVMAVEADLTLFRRTNEAGRPIDNILYHELSKAKLAELHKMLGDPDAVKNFVPDGNLHTDSERAYAFYCETVLGEGRRIPHLWSESGRFRGFKQRNPIAVLLLQKVLNNFVGNLIECLQRVSDDIPALQACFLGGRAPKRIVKIVSTGSDSQRGGKQVLFFDVETADKALTRIVYKPSDIEIDFLLVGHNGGAVNDFLTTQTGHPGYPNPNQSLFEMVNETLGASGVMDLPESRDLSTYVVLPRNPGSKFSPQETAPPIRKSYGYLEFLSYTPAPPRPPSGISDSLIDFFTTDPAPAESDWIVNNGNDAAACMRNWGRMSMLACVMLMRDLHHENRRLRHGNPTLIDLEMTGTGRLHSAYDTGLFRDITKPAHSMRGEQVAAFVMAQEMHDGVPTPNQAPLAGPIVREHGKGLMTWGLDQLYLSPVEGGSALQCLFRSDDAQADIQDGMFDILDKLSPDALKAWITRTSLGQVIVRYLSLEAFGELIEGAFIELLEKHTLATTPEDELQRYWDERLKIRRRASIKSWAAQLYAPPDRQDFLFETPEGIGMDLMNLDLPRFYRRLNSKSLLSSTGKQAQFKKEYFDLDVLFPIDLFPQYEHKIEGAPRAEVAAEVAEKLKFRRFLSTTGLDDLSTVIGERLGLVDEQAKVKLVDKDMKSIGILPTTISGSMFGEGR